MPSSANAIRAAPTAATHLRRRAYERCVSSRREPYPLSEFDGGISSSRPEDATNAGVRP